MSQIYMVRCPKCKRENYALNVASGVCTWCGHRATEQEVDGHNVWVAKERQ